jgi:hypothetical protein
MGPSNINKSSRLVSRSVCISRQDTCLLRDLPLDISLRVLKLVICSVLSVRKFHIPSCHWNILIWASRRKLVVWAVLIKQSTTIDIDRALRRPRHLQREDGFKISSGLSSTEYPSQHLPSSRKPKTISKVFTNTRRNITRSSIIATCIPETISLRQTKSSLPRRKRR